MYEYKIFNGYHVQFMISVAVVFFSLVQYRIVTTSLVIPTIGTVFDEILTSIYLEIAFILGLQTL